MIYLAKRVLICGDRKWENKNLIRDVLLRFPKIETVIHGDARGADRIGAEVANDLDVCSVIAYPADWDKYKKAAGPIRNKQMLDEGKPDIVLAFHVDLAASKGTKDMVRIALKAGVPVLLNGLPYGQSPLLRKPNLIWRGNP